MHRCPVDAGAAEYIVSTSAADGVFTASTALPVRLRSTSRSFTPSEMPGGSSAVRVPAACALSASVTGVPQSSSTAAPARYWIITEMISATSAAGATPFGAFSCCSRTRPSRRPLTSSREYDSPFTENASEDDCTAPHEASKPDSETAATAAREVIRRGVLRVTWRD